MNFAIFKSFNITETRKLFNIEVEFYMNSNILLNSIYGKKMLHHNIAFVQFIVQRMNLANSLIFIYFLR